MRSTITLNGQESSEIEGLLIQSLPPISKPLQRTQIEEIDGRDGDIVTNLGFSAYTKEFTIGLYGDFDIDEIISYFNSEGTVTFSNEPDKYYNYQIIDQIDFERLIRFRTATVSMHCQPFKYSATEGADILSASDNFATLNQSINTDAQYFTYTSNVQDDVTASRNNVATGSKFFATFTMNVVEGLTYYFSGSTSTPVTMYGYKNRIWGTSAGFSGRKLTSDFKYTATYTGQLIIGFYGTGTDLYIRNFFVTNEAGVTISGEGTLITLEGTSESPFIKFDLKGDTTQQTYSGKNLFNTLDQVGIYRTTIVSKTDNSLVLEPTASGVCYVNYRFDAKPSTIYTASAIAEMTGSTTGFRGMFYVQSYNGSSYSYITNIVWGSVSTRKSVTFTTPADCQKIRLDFYPLDRADSNYENMQVEYSEIQVEEGSPVSSYEPYVGGTASPNPDYPQNVNVVTGEQTITISDGNSQSQSYTVDLGSIELCKIGDYQDYIYKSGDDWYVHKETKKLDVSALTNWYYNSNTNFRTTTGVSDIKFPSSSDIEGDILCPDYSALSGNAAATSTYDYGIALGDASYVSIRNKNLTSLSELNTYFANNQVYAYVVLATPTDTKITDNTLIGQLEALMTEAHAYDGTTVLASSADDLPHIMSVAVGASIDGTITNSGNTTARPKLTLFGSGTIGIYLNGNQIFNVNLGTEGHITIDTNAMEAYQDTTDNLMNRLVTGDYSSFVLQAGDNQISFSGNATMCVVENYSRWI